MYVDCGRMIACKVNIDGVDIGLVNVYAPNVEIKRRQLWEKFSNLDWDTPTFFGGD